MLLCTNYCTILQYVSQSIPEVMSILCNSTYPMLVMTDIPIQDFQVISLIWWGSSFNPSIFIS